MKVVCSHCGKQYKEKEPLENEEASHGICDDCFPGVIADMERQMAEIARERHETDERVDRGNCRVFVG